MASPPRWPDDSGDTLGDGQTATAVHHPASFAELATCVRVAVADGLAVYPQGGGTALDAGGIPARPGVAIRTGRLDRVVDYPVADMTITVEAGMTLEAIHAVVHPAGQRLPIEAAYPKRATLGGIFATATTGPRRFGWGRPRDAIIGVAFVSGAGELIRGGGRVVKNVAGYDFPKLLTGSWGTLGIITELTLKVNPRPEAAAVARVEFAELVDLAVALDQLNTSGTRPIALEIVDLWPTGRTDAAKWVLLVGFEGNQAAVAWQIDRLASEVGRTDLAVLRDDEAESIWRGSVGGEASAAGEIKFRASFAPAAAIRFLDRVPRERWSIRVHAGNGVVRGTSRLKQSLSEFATEIQRLRAEASALGGSLILERCPTAWKGQLGVWGERRPDWTIAERVKAALDPGSVLNPGRFIGTI